MRRGAGPTRRSGRETISTQRQAGCAWLSVLIAATFEICKASRRRVQSSKVRWKTRAPQRGWNRPHRLRRLVGPARRSSPCPGLTKPRLDQVLALYAVVFVELRKATRRDISRDATWAQYAQMSSRLISTAKCALLRSGVFVELRGATRVRLATLSCSGQSAPQSR